MNPSQRLGYHQHKNCCSMADAYEPLQDIGRSSFLFSPITIVVIEVFIYYCGGNQIGDYNAAIHLN